MAGDESETRGTVRCSITVTSEPWNSAIDAIVVPVGGGLGSLGRALHGVFPDAALNRVSFEQIDFDRPLVVPLPPRREQPDQVLRRAILVDPGKKTGPLDGIPTDESIAIATRAAIEAAAAAGANAIGLPLLATGDLGKPLEHIAQIVVPSAVDTAQYLPGVDSLVFLCQTTATARAIRSAFAQLPAIETTSSSLELAGGISSDLVDPTVGIPLANDRLGVAPYVSMLAMVIADRSTPLPLSVGVFGEWGSGKSYFMAMLRDQIRYLTESGHEQYRQDIVQIGFNAWHYADSNLWASLGDEIFGQLAGVHTTHQPRAEQIRAQLTERLQERRRLQDASREARATAAQLQTDVERAIGEREASARTVLAALRASKYFRNTLTTLWRQLGVQDEKDQAELLVGRLNSTLDETRLLRRAAATRLGWVSLAAAVVVVGTAVLGPILLAGSREYTAWAAALLATSTGLGGISLVLGRARAGLRTLREVQAELRSAMRTTAEGSVHNDMAETLTRLRTAQAEQHIAQAQLDDVVAHIGELGRQLAQAAPGRRLYSFLAARAQSDSYAGNLSLVSTIRKDLGQLVELMHEWRAHPDQSRTHRPIDRIVLYIDDLDRCSPSQVVAVLQAVHLLLAFDLFVVVVGVDPRWLLQSLRSRYADLLHDDEHHPGENWHTPADYLEKILNIPFALPKMPPDRLDHLLRSLAETAALEGSAPQPTGDTRGTSRQDTSQRGSVVEPDSDIEVLHRRESRPSRPLTEPELTLLGALEPLVRTPREAKRLFNLYRMVRATRDLSDGSRFLGLDGRTGEFEAVVVLLGLLTGYPRLFQEILDAPPDPASAIAGGIAHRASGTAWTEFVSDLRPQFTDPAWGNGVTGQIPDNDVAQWNRLYDSLVVLSTLIAVPDLSDLQLWLPRIRCFSYVLSTR